MHISLTHSTKYVNYCPRYENYVPDMKMLSIGLYILCYR